MLAGRAWPEGRRRPQAGHFVYLNTAFLVLVTWTSIKLCFKVQLQVGIDAHTKSL